MQYLEFREKINQLLQNNGLVLCSIKVNDYKDFCNKKENIYSYNDIEIVYSLSYNSGLNFSIYFEAPYNQLQTDFTKWYEVIKDKIQNDVKEIKGKIK